MEITETIYTPDRKVWRKWLEQNFTSKSEIWLVYPNKKSGKPRILYNDAVEEALCFGWIDSIIKSIDENHSAQRFTPRKTKGNFSQPNIERLNWLKDHKMIHPSVLDSIKNELGQPFHFPIDILDELKKDASAWSNYQNFSPAYQRIRIAYINSARKRPEEFKKRLENFIKKTRDNKKIGFGGIEKYY
ncbi:MAG: YdeI/OmpD-associated family protein [Candidatus Kariarchaeaceae archaeon]|jgi:uncharacterized protein YdeI (YjbR/CyaY-like superfamily)